MARVVDVVAFGEVLWDIFQSGADRFEREIGGAPANLCVHVARLGGRAALVGAVGDDPFGAALTARLGGEGVDVSMVARRRERTGIAFVLRTKSGQPRFLFYRQATADMAMVPGNLRPRLPRARFALVGSSTLVRPTLARTTFAFLAKARAAGARVVVDLNVRAHLWPNVTRVRQAIASLLAHADLVKASADDLAALCVGAEAGALSWVRKRAPAATIFVTRGSGRSTALGPFGRVDVAAKKSRCIDATGAGDAFLAGCLRLLAGTGRPEAHAEAEPVRAALALGNAMGARVVRSRGAVSADTSTLRAPCERALARLARSL